MRRPSEPILIILVLAAIGACGETNDGQVASADATHGNDTPDGVIDPSCTPRLERTLRPDFASAPHAIAIDDERVAVAAGIGLELYRRDVGTEPIGWVDLDGVGLDVALDGDRAAVAQGADGVSVVDLTDLTVVAHVPSFGSALGVALAGDRLIVADGEAGLAIWDIASPDAVLVARVALAQPAASVAFDVTHDLAYVAAHTLGLVVVDLADATVVSTHGVDPFDVTWTVGDAVKVRLAEGRAWVAAGYAGVRIFDLADPRAPRASGEFFLDSNRIVASDIAFDLEHAKAYVADYWLQVSVLDISDPDAPQRIASYTESDSTSGIAYGAGRVWVAARVLEVFDVTAEPTLVTTFGHHSPWGSLVGLASDGDRIVVGDGPGAVRVVRQDGDGFVDLARYATEEAITAVALRGDRLIVARDTTQPMVLTAALDVVPLGDGGDLTATASLALAGRISDLTFAGADIVYGAVGDGLVLLDLSGEPKLLAGPRSASIGGERLSLDGDRLALAGNYRGVSFFDVHDRRAPVQVASYPSTGMRSAVALTGTSAWLGVGSSLVHVDVSDPNDLRELARLELPGLVIDVAIADPLVWVAAGDQILAVDPGTTLPVASIASAGRAPTALVADHDAVLASDDFEALARVTLACDAASTHFVDPGAPTSAGTQWVDLVPGTDAVVLDGVTVGYTQATAPRPGPDELVIATGAPAEPVLTRHARLGPPAADRARLRILDTVDALASVRLGDSRWSAGGAFDVSSAARLELWAGDGTTGFVAALPALSGGHAYDLIVARATTGADEGGLFALLVRDDGLTQQVGPAAHQASLRVVNLGARPLLVTIDGSEPKELSTPLAPATSSLTFVVAPGSRHLVARDAENDKIVYDNDIIPFAAGPSYTFVLYPKDGAFDGVRVTDGPNVSSSSTSTELQLVHGADDLGAVTARLVPTEGGLATTLRDVSPGEVARTTTTTASYDLALDVDGDGADDMRWQVGYFPAYGFNLYLARHPDGVLHVGTQSVGDDTIYWRWTEEQLAGLRVLNLTGRDMWVEVTPWFETEGVTDRIASEGGSNEFQLLAGAQRVTLRDAASDETWTWQGTLASLTHSTVVFDVDAEGAITSTLLQDAPLPPDSQASGLRVLHAASGPPISVTLAESRGEDGVALGHIAHGELTTLVTRGGDGPFNEHWLRVVPDGGTPLTFALGSAPAWLGMTNIAYVDDDVWPHLVVQGSAYQTTTLYAEELQTRLRVVYLPTTQSVLQLAVDDAAALSVQGRPTWGQSEPGYFGVSDVMSLVGGTHTLHLTTEGGALATLAPSFDLRAGASWLLVVYGSPTAPSMTLLEDDAPSGAAATVFNASAQPIGVYTAGIGQWTPRVASLAPGATSARVPLDAGDVLMGVDWQADGQVDWQTMQNDLTDHTWVFATAAPAASPYLLVLHRGRWPFLQGELVAP